MLIPAIDYFVSMFDTVRIPVDSVSQAMSDNLLSLGYRGIPTDGAEALYVPRIDALANCMTDTDCQIASN